MRRGQPSLTWDLPHSCSHLHAKRGCVETGGFATTHDFGSAGAAAYEADGTGLQCTEVFGQSVPLLDVATALQGAVRQGASLRGNRQGEGAGSQHCHKRVAGTLHTSSLGPFKATLPLAPSDPGWSRLCSLTAIDSEQ